MEITSPTLLEYYEEGEGKRKAVNLAVTQDRQLGMNILSWKDIYHACVQAKTEELKED